MKIWEIISIKKILNKVGRKNIKTLITIKKYSYFNKVSGKHVKTMNDIIIIIVYPVYMAYRTYDHGLEREGSQQAIPINIDAARESLDSRKILKIDVSTTKKAEWKWICKPASYRISLNDIKILKWSKWKIYKGYKYYYNIKMSMNNVN